MSEFSLIEKYCMDLGVSHTETVLSVGDDAAIVNIPDGFQLVVSVDTLVEGTHFLKGLAPELVAHKLLAVNLSDMAAMGSRPKWATVASTLPRFDEDWTERYTSTLDQVATQYGVEIIGGDTTEGARSISLTIMGLTPKGLAMTRSGAQVGDKVYCSGNIGDAALALTRLMGEQELPDDIFSETLPALHMPQPQVTLGQRLLGLATSCIDLSDGLVGDAVHVANRSNVTIEIETNDVPLSDAYQRYIDGGGFLRYALAGGDDYQLLFTVPEGKEDQLNHISKDLNVKITAVGQVIERGEEPVVTMENGMPTPLKLRPFQHFF